MATLAVTKRNESLKPKQLRRKGIIPAVLYGKNLDASISIQVNQRDAEKFLKSTHTGAQAEIDLEGDEYLAMVKTVSYDILSQKLAHIEFQVLTAGETVKTSAHIRFINREQVSSDGILNEMLNEIQLECLPKDMPDEIEVDLAGLQVGDSIEANQLDIMKDERYKILTPADSVLVHISTPSVEVEEEEEEAGEESVEVPLVGSEEE